LATGAMLLRVPEKMTSSFPASGQPAARPSPGDRSPPTPGGALRAWVRFWGSAIAPRCRPVQPRRLAGHRPRVPHPSPKPQALNRRLGDSPRRSLRRRRPEPRTLTNLSPQVATWFIRIGGLAWAFPRRSNPDPTQRPPNANPNQLNPTKSNQIQHKENLLPSTVRLPR
jgi:hypothetical protein